MRPFSKRSIELEQKLGIFLSAAVWLVSTILDTIDLLAEVGNLVLDYAQERLRQA